LMELDPATIEYLNSIDISKIGESTVVKLFGGQIIPEGIATRTVVPQTQTLAPKWGDIADLNERSTDPNSDPVLRKKNIFIEHSIEALNKANAKLPVRTVVNKGKIVSWEQSTNVKKWTKVAKTLGRGPDGMKYFKQLLPRVLERAPSLAPDYTEALQKAREQEAAIKLAVLEERKKRRETAQADKTRANVQLMKEAKEKGKQRKTVTLIDKRKLTEYTLEEATQRMIMVTKPEFMTLFLKTLKKHGPKILIPKSTKPTPFGERAYSHVAASTKSNQVMATSKLLLYVDPYSQPSFEIIKKSNFNPPAIPELTNAKNAQSWFNKAVLNIVYTLSAVNLKSSNGILMMSTRVLPAKQINLYLIGDPKPT